MQPRQVQQHKQRRQLSTPFQTRRRLKKPLHPLLVVVAGLARPTPPPPPAPSPSSRSLSVQRRRLLLAPVAQLQWLVKFRSIISNKIGRQLVVLSKFRFSSIKIR
jgi:hypothetical protein